MKVNVTHNQIQHGKSDSHPSALLIIANSVKQASDTLTCTSVTWK